MSDVFQALYEHWKKIKNPAKKQQVSKILLESKLYKDDIDAIRAERARLRTQAERAAGNNGMQQLGELHVLEYEACRVLCPTLTIGRGSAKKAGWAWVRKQPWAKDFMAPPIEKRFH